MLGAQDACMCCVFFLESLYQLVVWQRYCGINFLTRNYEPRNKKQFAFWTLSSFELRLYYSKCYDATGTTMVVPLFWGTILKASIHGLVDRFSLSLCYDQYFASGVHDTHRILLQYNAVVWQRDWLCVKQWITLVSTLVTMTIWDTRSTHNFEKVMPENYAT